MLPFLSSGPQIGVAMTALYGLLAVTSLLVQRLTTPAGSLRNQVNAWWRIFPVVTVALLLYPLGPLLLACLICALAVRELAPYSGTPPARFQLYAAILGTTVLLLQWQLPSTLPALLPLLIGCQLCLFHLRPGPRTLIPLLLSLTVASAWVLTRFAALPFGEDNLAWLFYLFIVTALNDIGQFVSGKIFGRQKIAPTISPNKTWQGLAGGIVVSQLVTHAIAGYLHLGSPGRVTVYAVLLSIGGFFGDLLFSAAKRHLGIKDFSQLIPGHGGILDRVDSLVVTAPLLYCLLRFFE